MSYDAEVYEAVGRTNDAPNDALNDGREVNIELQHDTTT